MLVPALIAIALCQPPVVDLDPFEVSSDHTLPISQLTATLGRDGHAGLGYVKVHMRAAATARVVPRPDGDCMDLRVRAGYYDGVLVVARELPEGSCGYQHVLQHEQVHVQLYRSHLDGLADRASAKLAKLAAPDVAAMERAASEAVLDELAAVMAAHQAHDSDDEYARNSVACGGQLRRIVRRTSG